MHKNIFITQLRGVSIIVVILMHYFMISTISAPLSFIANGYYGVALFFSISGFLITSNILDRYGEISSTNLKEFYTMRLARTVPCVVILVMILSLLAMANIQYFEAPKENPYAIADSIFYIMTLRFNLYFFHYILHQQGWLGWAVLWSLSVEQMFYFLYPLIGFILRKEKFLVIFLFIVVLNGVLMRHQLADIYSYQACFDIIAMGSLAAFASHRFIHKCPNYALSLVKWLGAILVLFTYTKLNIATHIRFGPSLLGIGGAMMLFGCWTGQERMNSRRFDFLGFVGRYSYEIYLFHLTIFLIGLVLYPGFFAGTYWGLIADLIIVFCVSAFVGNKFSEPINRFLRLNRFLRHKLI